MAETNNDIILAGYINPIWWLKNFLPRWFPDDVPWVHWGIAAIYTKQTDFLFKCPQLDKILSHFTYKDDEGNKQSIFKRQTREDGTEFISMTITQKTSVMLPRGYAKTTLTNGILLWLAVYKEVRFAVMISETADAAKSQLGNIKRQLETNTRLREVYGDLVPPQRQGLRWQADCIDLQNGVIIQSVGRGGQVRGANEDGQRPDLILLDDVEDKESVSTAEQRAKTLEWYLGDVEPALPRIDPECRSRVIALGTLLNAEALLMKFAIDPSWVSITFGAYDNDNELLWAAALDERKIEQKKAMYALQGMLHIFYLEFFNQITVPEIAKFPEALYRVVPRARSEFASVALMFDPAISEKKDADFCAFVVVGMTERGLVHVLDFYAERGMSPRAQVDKYFELHYKWKPDIHGVETIAYQKALVHLLKEEMFREGKKHGSKAYFEITPVGHHTQSKVTRVEGILQPRYAAGYITFQQVFPQLKSQLTTWPNGKKDGPDCLAMGIVLLDPMAAMAGISEDGLHNPEDDEYEPISKLLGNWRGI